MKKSVLLFLFSLMMITAAGQQVSELKIKKLIPGVNSNPSTTLEIYVPMSMEGFDWDNPIDYTKSNVQVFTDDTGKDLLMVHNNIIAEHKNKGYTTERIYQFGGAANYGSNEDINLVFSVKTTPAQDAKELHLKASIMLNFRDDSATKSLEIEDIPVEMAYNSKGHQSTIGPIKIEGRGSATLNEKKYNIFRVVGSEIPISQVEIMGGDDSEVVKGVISLNQNDFVFSEVPETVNLKVTYSNFRKVKVPIDLKFSIGL